MHLLATQAGVVDGAPEAVDLDQPPGDVVFLSSADSELAAIAQACDAAEGVLTVRLCNTLRLQHNLSVDTYIDRTLSHARLIVLRLLGGASYWRYGLSQIEALARDRGIALAVLSGDAQPDAGLTAHSTLAPADAEHLHAYLAKGGPDNAQGFLSYCRYLLGDGAPPSPAREAPHHGHFKIGLPWIANGPVAPIVFYRSVVEGGLTAPVTALAAALHARGINALPLYVSSLRDRESAAFIVSVLSKTPPDIVLNATAFAVSSGTGTATSPFAAFDCPVLQAVFAGCSEEQWRASPQGLGPRDLAMNVVLPELDGRILTRAVSFKAQEAWHERTQSPVVAYRPVQDRIDFVADQAANWIRLRRLLPHERKVAIVLANYPGKSGRIAGGVGYDTPASTIAILAAMKDAGYVTGAVPASGTALMGELAEFSRQPPTPDPSPQGGGENERAQLCFTLPSMGRVDAPSGAAGWGDVRRQPPTPNPSPQGGGENNSTCLSLAAYRDAWERLPPIIRHAVEARWGAPENDPSFEDGAFRVALKTYGNVVIGIQPARGRDIDIKALYHDAALVPPHSYFAFYFALRGVHAVIHNGKHGNLEWLPGKAVALSQDCYPEAILGPLPQIYPFIVNDPGEGTQAKRRTSAVIIDHLTPPLTRAEIYGPLKDLEALVDEYYLAFGLDRRRMDSLKRDILDLTRASALDRDAGFTGDDEADLRKLDAYLCDLKEAQIREGLHVLGSSPAGRLETDLIAALTRTPRSLGEGGDASLIRAIAADLGFAGFDPLACDLAASWMGMKPEILGALSPDPWRSNGDTVERLELFASGMIDGLPPPGPASEAVLQTIASSIRPALRACGEREMSALLVALEGRFVAPGPSGAPTRGRLDVLPTGRNFYSVDNRTIPTPTAWTHGARAAEDMLARHFQDFGTYPKAIGLTAWGTSNMRTGGDDVAQVLALIGAKPVWEPSSWRVTGYEIIPLAKLGRPRVDVTVRISGFFRDAFPQQIELMDRALRAAGALDEDDDDNPLAARMRSDAAALIAGGATAEAAERVAGGRVFGSEPGGYGAGVKAVMDRDDWETPDDLGRAYLTSGSFVYGAHDQGRADAGAFTTRLKSIEAVVHAQDNREHDLLDSDEYYQFEGGMSAAIAALSGASPRIYHADVSRPEAPVIRTLDEEIARVMRSRVVNPKWISGMKRHGYKGAFEIAATVDYMFAFAATTGSVKTHHFDLAYDAFIADSETRDFIAANNPAALGEIARRFEDAIARKFWTPRSNSAHDLLRTLAGEHA
ncbi:cobaltochelatase subunit CobN [soil metagenome]